MEAVKRDIPAKVCFQEMSKHMLKQNAKSCSATEPDYSMYRGAGGKRCPVGIFMSQYRPSYEGMRAEDVVPALDIIVTPTVMKVLKAVQDIHDNVPVTAWRARLKGVAIKFNFDVGGKKLAPRKKAKKARRR